MNSHTILRFAFSLSFCLAPSLLYAQQLAQPASVLPWQAPLPEMRPAVSRASDSPAWLADSVQPLPQQAFDRAGLPMVEKESYANLGQLNQNSLALATRLPKRKHSSKTAGFGPFKLFRALGFQANR